MKKRLWAWLLVLAIIAGLFADLFPTSQVMAADQTQEVERYTVLLLDTSGSMSGRPMEVAREAAQKFCISMLNAPGSNFIAVVAYSDRARVLCEYSDQADTLKDAIDRMGADGATNTNDALLTAEKLVNQAPDTAVKNVVLLSDGLPQSGAKLSSGPYTSGDSSSYAFANAVYATAQALQQKCSVYALGFFHKLTGDTLAFGQRLMQDIQNSGYYNVTDAEDLEFVFGELTDELIQAKLKEAYVRQHREYFSGDFRKEIVEIQPFLSGSTGYHHTDHLLGNLVQDAARDVSCLT